ncbi:hypothetical protein [Mucilaginibacter mallensis]|nr:hypothetical protein [Mucilaginibacter mallensis]
MEIITYSDHDWKYFEDNLIKHKSIDNLRNYTDVSFTGNVKHDVVEHVRLNMALNKLNKTKDVINGVRISYGPHSKYKDFVSGIDDVYQSNDGDIGVLLKRNQVYVWNANRLDTKPLHALHPAYIIDFSHDVFYTPIQPTFYDRLKEYATRFYAVLIEFWPSVLAFIAMLWFAFSKKRYYLFRAHN